MPKDWRLLVVCGRSAALAVVLVVCAGSAALALPTKEGEATRLVIPRIVGAPRLADVADMAAADVFRGLVRVEGFVSRLPRDGETMSERTVVYLGYDDKSIHAVFVCFDSAPAGIGAHLNGRDRIPDADDSVALQLDTFRDRKHAYGFQVNPLGVQQDAMWTEGKGWDLSFDTVWHAEARLTPRGYVALVSVPFKSLRFTRESAQAWGLLFYRGIARKNEEGFWPAYSTRIAGRMNQAAVLDGLQSVSPGRNAQVVLYTSARSYRALDADGPQGPRFVSDPFDGKVGVDGKLVLKDSLTVDVTVNPDFSQVESDEPQVTVNKRFETFFPEKRPFFLENASYFDTPVPLLFTRRIVQPDVGARVTGRLGPYALGALLVRDQPEPGPSAVVGIFRANRDIGAESSLGVFLGSRSQGDGVNRVGGFDGRVKIATRWVGAFQAVTSFTREIDGREVSGTAYSASLLRTGQKLNYNADLNGRSPGFRSASGFIERTDVRSLDQTLSYRERPSDSWLLSWGPDLVVSEVRDHRNRRLDRTVTPRIAFEWPGQTSLLLFFQDARIRLRPWEVPSLEEEVAFAQDRKGAEFATSLSRALTLTLKASTGSTVNLVPAVGARPTPADVMEGSVSAEVRPSPRLSLGTSYLLTRLTDPTTGARIFTDQIVRAKTNFQFTRTVSARTIVQYDSLAANPGATSLAARRNLNVDILLTWLRSPGTALYLGYNNNLENVDPALAVTPTGLQRTPRGLISDGRQFFVKFSYLLRM